MHEASLAQELVSIIERVARENDARRVTSAVVEVGELSCVVPEALGFAFEVARQNTVAAECTLTYQPAPLTVTCGQCGYDGRATRDTTGCPQCGHPVQVISGRELRLVSIDVEDDDA